MFFRKSHKKKVVQKINIAELLRSQIANRSGRVGGKNILDAMLTELRNRLLWSKREKLNRLRPVVSDCVALGFCLS